MIMRNLFHISICFCFIAVIGACAQPDGRVFLNPDSVSRDTLDFDITLFGKPLESEFYVENTGTSAIYIPKKTVPFFSIERYSNDANDFRHLEFINETQFGFQVTPAKHLDAFRLIFTSNPDTAKLDYALGFKIARMVIGLSDNMDAAAPFKKTDTFTLVAWKTKNYLASKREEILFDTVYLNAENVQSQWMLKNVSDAQITVYGNSITPLSPVIGASGFSVLSPLEQVAMPHDSRQPWTIKYRPTARGADSSRLALVYSPNIDGQTDSTQVILRGIGVQQEIILSNRTTGQPNPITIRGDTIDLGDVDAGKSAQALIILENRGNIAFGGSAGELGEQSEFFTAERFLNVSKRLAPGGFDTAIVSFKPTRRGTYVASFIVNSDIRSRVPTAPDIASKLTWHIRGRAIEPELALSAELRDTVSFGLIIMPADKSCKTAATTRRFIARNIGNSTLSLTIASPQFPFQINGGARRDIPASDSSVIEVEFSPQAEGYFASSITIATNEQDGKNIRNFALTGTAAVQKVQIALPNIASSAGRKIIVPIMTSASVKRADYFAANLVYDTILLDFIGFDRFGSSSELSSLDVAEQSNGSIRFSLSDQGGGLFAKDTLIKAVFNTYFGDPTPTALTLTNLKAGGDGCDSAAYFTTLNGSYSADSSCGSAYRVIMGMKGIFRFAQIGENPSARQLDFAFETGAATETSIILYNSVGKEIAELARGVFGEGIHYAGIATDAYSAGLYFVEMRAGLYRKLFPVFISR